jgi:hypothetical protein
MPPKSVEREKAERLLKWMIANPPAIKGETSHVIKRRRDVLNRVLGQIKIDDAGCMLYGSRSWSGDRPYVLWPNVSERYPDGLPGNVYDHRKHRKQNLSRLLLSSFFPHMVLPKYLSSTCGVESCINPQHSQKRGKHKSLNRTKLSTEQVREIVRLRLSGVRAQDIGDMFGIDRGHVGHLVRGEQRADETADLRAESVYRPYRLTREDVRAILQTRLDSPLMMMKDFVPKMMAEFNVTSATIYRVLAGDKGYGARDMDLRDEINRRKAAGWIIDGRKR